MISLGAMTAFLNLTSPSGTEKCRQT